jgi:hypothetical protein
MLALIYLRPFGHSSSALILSLLGFGSPFLGFTFYRLKKAEDVGTAAGLRCPGCGQAFTGQNAEDHVAKTGQCPRCMRAIFESLPTPLPTPASGMPAAGSPVAPPSGAAGR